MSNTSIISVKGSDAVTGARGDFEHVRTDSYSLNFWNLRNMDRSETHSNSYTIAIYINDGVLSVFDADGVVREIGAGDSVLIPAGTDYSMSTEYADAVESRIG